MKIVAPSCDANAGAWAAYYDTLKKEFAFLGLFGGASKAQNLWFAHWEKCKNQRNNTMQLRNLMKERGVIVSADSSIEGAFQSTIEEAGSWFSFSKVLIFVFILMIIALIFKVFYDIMKAEDSTKAAAGLGAGLGNKTGVGRAFTAVANAK